MGLAVTAVVAVIWYTGRKDSTQTLEAFLLVSGIDQSVEQSLLLDRNGLTDISLSWSLDLQPIHTREIISASPFLRKADVSDFNWHIGQLKAKGLLGESFDPGGFTLYRGEIDLGQHTICPGSPCGIHLLSDGALAYLTINSF